MIIYLQGLSGDFNLSNVLIWMRWDRIANGWKWDLMLFNKADSEVFKFDVSFVNRPKDLVVFIRRVGQHDNCLRIVVPDHLPKVTNCRLERMLSHDEFFQLLITYKEKTKIKLISMSV